MRNFIGFVLVVLLAPVAAVADVWKTIDDQGRITYSSKPSPGSAKINLPEISIVQPLAAPKSVGPAKEAKPSEGKANAGGVRDKIIQDELSAEEALLEKSKKVLDEASAVRQGNEKNYQKYLERLQPLKDDVARHEHNIEALKKELNTAR